MDTGATQHRKIVHFDRLKLCPPDTRLPINKQPALQQPDQSPSTPLSIPFGTYLRLVDDDTSPEIPRRYPARVHRPPVRYSDNAS